MVIDDCNNSIIVDESYMYPSEKPQKVWLYM